MRAMLAGLVSAFAGTVALASTLQAQSLSVTTNFPPVVPTVANLQANSNTGTSLGAGSVTLQIDGCKNNKTCSILISTTGLPGGGTLNWSTTSTGSGNQFTSCTAGSGGAISTTPTLAISCLSQNGNATRTGIVISFAYPVSWTVSTPGSFTTGLVFRLTTN